MPVTQVEDLRGSPMSVGSLEEIIDEKYVPLYTVQSQLKRLETIDLLNEALEEFHWDSPCFYKRYALEFNFFQEMMAMLWSTTAFIDALTSETAPAFQPCNCVNLCWSRILCHHDVHCGQDSNRAWMHCSHEQQGKVTRSFPNSLCPSSLMPTKLTKLSRQTQHDYGGIAGLSKTQSFHQEIFLMHYFGSLNCILPTTLSCLVGLEFSSCSPARIWFFFNLKKCWSLGAGAFCSWPPAR